MTKTTAPEPSEFLTAGDVLLALQCHRPGCQCARSAKAGKGLTHCPAHDDQKPSLSVTGRDGKDLYHCHAGCSQEAVLTAIRELSTGRLVHPTVQPTTAGTLRTTRYELRASDGRLQAVHVRKDLSDGNKAFSWRQPNGTSGLNGTGVADMLYGVELLAVDPTQPAAGPPQPVVLTEGEKAADALRDHGILALGTVSGAPDVPSESVLRHLVGRRVVLWPDNDDVGRQQMDGVATVLTRLGVDVKVVSWPEAPRKGDAADYVLQHDRAQLLALLKSARPAGVTRPRLPWATAEEFAAATPEAVEWLAEGYVAQRAILLLVAAIKTGKTTFLGHLVRCLLEGRPFLGATTKRCSVLWITEERSATFRRALERTGLLGHPRLHLLSIHDAKGTSWPEVVEDAEQLACQIGGPVVLLADTISRLAGIGGDSENDAGAGTEAMAPLEAAAAAGRAVVVAQHGRKAGGNPQEAGRGTTAIPGVADIIVQLTKPGASHPPTVRRMESASRFEETPDEALIDLVEGEYRMLGDSKAVAASQAQNLIRDALRDGPRLQSDLITLTGSDGKTLGEGTARRVLDSLAAKHLVERLGRGGRGDPFVWRLRDKSATPPVPVALSLEGVGGDVAAGLTAPRPYTVGGAVDFGALPDGDRSDSLTGSCPSCGKVDFEPQGDGSRLCACGRVWS